MELVPLKTIHGEEKGWKILEGLPVGDVCSRASVDYESSTATYTVRSFGISFFVSVSERRIFSDSPVSVFFLETFRDFFNLSLLWYLTSARDIPASGRLIRPLDVRGGQRFFSGTHVLPLDRIAALYGKDKTAFIGQGEKFCAEVVNYGDVALRLLPLPRVPITMILWLEDEEFPARADLLFDSTCDLQISLSDIVWSLAMLTCLVMLEPPEKIVSKLFPPSVP